MTIPADITAVKQYIPAAEFRKVLKDVPSGIFSMDAWVRWHERLGISPGLPCPAAAFRTVRSDRNRAPFLGDRRTGLC